MKCERICDGCGIVIKTDTDNIAAMVKECEERFGVNETSDAVLSACYRIYCDDCYAKAVVAQKE